MLKRALKRHAIYPEILPEIPPYEVTVKYRSCKVKCGQEMSPEQMVHPPVVLNWTNEENRYYTLGMFDVDAIARICPTFRHWTNWLVGNIPGSRVDEGEVLFEYVGPCPPPRTGIHRFIFVVFQQPCLLQFKQPRVPNNTGEGRGHFSLHGFAEKYFTGPPVAVNLFQAQNDEAADRITMQLLGLLK